MESSQSAPSSIPLADFKLPPPKELDESNRLDAVNATLERIRAGAEEIRASFVDAGVSPDSQIASARGAMDMSMLLLIRVVTRVAKPPPELGGEEEEETYYQRQDGMRQLLCDYIMADFPAR